MCEVFWTLIEDIVVVWLFLSRRREFSHWGAKQHRFFDPSTPSTKWSYWGYLVAHFDFIWSPAYDTGLQMWTLPTCACMNDGWQKWNWARNNLKLPLVESFQALLGPIKLISALLWSVKVSSCWIHIWTLTFSAKILSVQNQHGRLCFNKFFIFSHDVEFSSFQVLQAGRRPIRLISISPRFTENLLFSKGRREQAAAAAEVSLSELRQIRPHSSGPSYLTRSKYSISNCMISIFPYFLFPTIIELKGPQLSYVLELDLSKLCEFCIKSCAERRKMTAVNWVN